MKMVILQPFYLKIKPGKTQREMLYISIPCSIYRHVL